MYNYGLVGNCQVSALINLSGSIDWLCLPHPDSDPVFGQLLDPDGGSFSITPATSSPLQCQQYYIENTNILVTEIGTKEGDRFRITDFCPRFEQHGRLFRPLSLFRIVEPLAGSPAIRVQCNPVMGWDKKKVQPVRGSSHLRFDIRGESLRLSTTMPLTYLSEGTLFSLKEKHYFALTWGASIKEDLVQLAESNLAQSRDYWRTWVKHCSIPSRFQSETIRSALALKLHCYDDTGAILAATTTSLPEDPAHDRNWDYRFCWLRDSYFVLSALHNLGQFEEMEGFLKFLLDLAHQHQQQQQKGLSTNRLAPVYKLNQSLPLPETILPEWAGYAGCAPVRCNNQAAEHIQNDVYGEMVLTLAPIFFDERFIHLRTREHEELMERLGVLCSEAISRPDAGLWEVRNGWQEHTFTNAMSWAGLERLERIQKRGYLKNLEINLDRERQRAEAAIDKAARDGLIRNGPNDPSLDAALSLLAVLRYPREDLCRNTVDHIMQALNADNNDGGFFYRYVRSDDFGTPRSAFVVCSFWIAQALAQLGQRRKAMQILKKTVKAANHVGLYSEHYLPSSRRQLGNFPQAYSHVGLINAAFATSPPWSQVL